MRRPSISMAVRSRLVSASGRGCAPQRPGRGEVGFDPARVHLEAISPYKVGVVHDGAVEGQHRGHALDLELAQRAAGAGQGLLARGCR
jgi:hypothetical protein